MKGQGARSDCSSRLPHNFTADYSEEKQKVKKKRKKTEGGFFNGGSGISRTGPPVQHEELLLLRSLPGRYQL